MADIDDSRAFYLGRRHDLATGQTSAEPLLYDSADLTTHAVCVGMTGSGKTGLCLALLEEAALDGVPAIAIDPKGDLGNLLLAFPELRPGDFRPWIDESAAAREGVTPDQFAERTAELWKNGLAQWGQDGARIRRFKDAVDCAIYTPGSSAGLPLTVLKSFSAPPQAVLDDADALGDRVQAAASGLLALLGVNADPVNSREHILLSRVLDEAWRAGRDLTLSDVIHDIKDPPFAMIGAVPIDSFMSAQDRFGLSMRLNNLLASPSFASWLEGEPLEIDRLLYTTDEAGQRKPRLSILSIAHLGDQERMFFVTLLLNELISWMRSQPGTSSLRAILYMDEVFGYFPPTANPPAKRPMLTLLKQARAYGVGCVLATQNPVDLDYKGLSNAGTWLLGRLQTERDKARVIEGLEGASAEAGAQFDRGRMEATLAALGKRVFLMNNVHDAGPTVFMTRWALSYLAGPLTRKQIGELMAERKAAGRASVPAAEAAVAEAKRASEAEPQVGSSEVGARATAPRAAMRTSGRPLLSGEVVQRFVTAEAADEGATAGGLAYRPALLGVGRVHYVKAADDVDVWQDIVAVQAVDGDLAASPWDGATVLAKRPDLNDQPVADAAFAPLPGSLGQKRTYPSLKRELDDWLYRTQRFVRIACPELGIAADAGESEEEFRRRAAPLLQAQRKARAIAERKAAAELLEKDIAAAEERRAEHAGWWYKLLFNAASRLAEIVVTGLVGRRSRKQVVTATLWNQAMKSRRLAAEAKKVLKEKKAALAKLEAEETKALQQFDVPLPPAVVPITKTEVAPRKSDVDVDEVVLAWLPWHVTSDGQSSPAFRLPASRYAPANTRAIAGGASPRFERTMDSEINQGLAPPAIGLN